MSRSRSFKRATGGSILLSAIAFGVARPLVTGCGRRSRLVPVGDYAAMMKTGIICRKLRSIGSGKDAQVVEEYEIDTSAVEALNSMERRAAIETGQECDPDRSDLTVVDDGSEGAFHSGAQLTAIKLLKRSTPAAFRVLFSFRCTGPLYLPKSLFAIGST